MHGFGITFAASKAVLGKTRKFYVETVRQPKSFSGMYHRQIKVVDTDKAHMRFICAMTNIRHDYVIGHNAANSYETAQIARKENPKTGLL